MQPIQGKNSNHWHSFARRPSFSAPIPAMQPEAKVPPGSALVQKAITLAGVGVTLHNVTPARDVAEAVHADLTESRQR
jgi:hypothetical protein